jgi:hypothetical protein
MRVAVAATWLAVLLLAACERRDAVAVLPSGEVSDYCAGSGPAIIAGDGITVSESDGDTDDVCAGVIARRSFRFALCTCEGYAASTRLTTDSFSSAAGAYDPGAAGNAGSVGVNGAFGANDVVDVRGSLWAGTGPGGGSSIGADLTVAGDLVHDGSLTGGAADVIVGHDANIQGTVSLASLSVGGALTVPSLAGVSTTGTLSYGSAVEATMALADPCSCADGDLVDVGRFVALHATDNDNAAVGLDPARLAAFGAADTTLDLPCGRYYLTAIDGDGLLTLRIHGRTALFVAGDARLRGGITVDIDAGAELDLFVAGILEAESDIRFGSAARPSKARLYVGGTGGINLTGSSLFAGNLYAPRAVLALSGPVELFGSLFVRQLQQAAPVTIHYDTDVLEADIGCPLTGASCQTCLDCPAQACTAGACGPCATDADCCTPLHCVSGACVPEL